MPANDRIVLDEYLEQRRLTIAPDLSADSFFTIFVNEQVLKNYDLSYDELLSGIVDGGNDGGIDAVYSFVNGNLVQSEFDADDYRGRPEVELVLVQSKRHAGFSEDAINRIVASCRTLLNLDTNLTLPEHLKRYNTPLLEQIETFRSAYRALIPQLPKLRVSVYYATLGDAPHPNVLGKVPELTNTVGELFSDNTVQVEFLGSGQLLTLARRRPSTTSMVRISESMSISERANVNLVPLTELHKLLSDEDGKLRKDLFESNVRDYQGSTAVNKEINETLANPQSEDFWWLNNGITILATRSVLAGKTLTMENVQIVNGLQTCAEIHKFFSMNQERLGAEFRQALVRIIAPEDDGSRDLIIKATNSQTYMPAVSLRATERLQRDIEDYFKGHGLYYDRRKNFYKNEGRPVASIVSIPYLAQAVVSIFLQEPDNSRARPSTLLKADEAYSRVFDSKRPVEFYLACARLMQRCEAVLRDFVQPEMRNNYRFQFAMLLTIALTRSRKPSVEQIIEASRAQIPDDIAGLTVSFLFWAYESLQEGVLTIDRIAKSPQTTTFLKGKIDDYLGVINGTTKPWFEQAYV